MNDTRFYPISSADIGELEKQYMMNAVNSGWVSSIGEFIARFEREFSGLCGADHGVSLSNGTSALFIALRAMGIGPGDEVIVPALTFAAVPAVVLHLGAVPVIVDVHPEYWALDPSLIERAISPRTRAVVAVHLYGHPADMSPLLSISKSHNLKVIEDCAEAHFAQYRGKTVGGLADAGCFSFYGNKIITTGEGGMVVTNNAELADSIRHLKDHAMSKQRRYWHDEAGYNFRMTNIQAALGCAQIARAREILDKRSAILRWYSEELAELDALELNPRMDWASPVNWLTSVVWKGADEQRRDALLSALKARGVDTRPFFVPVSHMPPYRDCRVVGSLPGRTPVADSIGGSGFNLPTYYALEENDVRHIAGILKEELRMSGGL